MSEIFDSSIDLSRRNFFTSAASGLGSVALASMLRDDGLLAAPGPHFAPKAKNCIYLFMEGGPSQMDLFDPKPKLNELDGEPMPDSMLDGIKFAFTQKESARLMGSPRTFQKYGQCGMDMSDLLPPLIYAIILGFFGLGGVFIALSAFTLICAWIAWRHLPQSM